MILMVWQISMEKKFVAVTSSKGDIGDKVLIIFQSQLHNWRNDNSLEAIIGDEKDQSDKNLPYDAYRHFMGFIKDVQLNLLFKRDFFMMIERLKMSFRFS